MKNHSCNLHAPLCGIFCPNSTVAARKKRYHISHFRRYSTFYINESLF
ncbi:MAG: DUF6783 domain-containing protein [Ruminococcus sp.]